MKHAKKRKKRSMKFYTFVSIAGLSLMIVMLLVGVSFLQNKQIIRQNAAGPTTYATCTGPGPAFTQGVCYSQANNCISQGLSELYNSLVPAAITQCAQNGKNMGVNTGTTISCCPNSAGYAHTYGTCGTTGQFTCTTDPCAGGPAQYSDVIPTQCSYNAYFSTPAVPAGSRMYCCVSPNTTPTSIFTPTPPPAGGTTNTPVNSSNVTFSLVGIGPSGNVSPIHKTRSYTLSFVTHIASGFLAQSNILGAQALTVSGMGTFDSVSGAFIDKNVNVGSVPAGVYDAIFHMNGALDKRVQDITGNSAITISNGQGLRLKPIYLNVGDIAPSPGGDNFVDIQDYNALITCISTKTCLNPTVTDINDDGNINDTDMQLLQNSFGSVGDSFSTPKFTCNTDPACSPSGTVMQMCQLLCKINPAP